MRHMGSRLRSIVGSPEGLRWSIPACRAASRALIVAVSLSLVPNSGCERAPAPKPPVPISPAAKNPRAPQGGVGGGGSAGSAGSAGQQGAGSSTLPQTTKSQPSAPSDAPAASPVRVSNATSDPKLIEIAKIAMPKPVTWQWQSPTVQFRALQYSVPAKAAGASDAELVFSVFAAGDGGPMEANVKRWISQFRAEDGSPAEAIIVDSTVNGIAVKTIELAGLYQGMGQAAPRPGIRQLGAILRTADGTVFIRLVGPDATVEAWRSDFDAMIAGVRPQS